MLDRVSRTEPAPDEAPKPRLWSASQASTYLDCSRKWAFAYIEKRRPPETKSQRIGTRVHELLEASLLGSRAIKVSNSDDDRTAASVASAMLSHTPRAPVLAVEQYRKRGNWRGYIDLEFQADPVGVSDHKTRSDVSRYIPTSAELARDVQATTYVYLVAGAYDLGPEVVVPLWWTYGQTRPPHRATSVRSSLRVGEAERRIALLDELVVTPGNALHTARTPANEVEPNPHACRKYGGCPYRDVCVLTMQEKLIGLAGQKEDDVTTWQKMLEDLKKREASTPGENPQTQGDAIGGPYTGVNRPVEDYQTPPTAQAPAQTFTQPTAQAPAQTFTQPTAQAPAQTFTQPTAQAPAQTEPEEQTVQRGRGYLLLLDCTWDKANSVEKLVELAHQRVKETFGVPHYKAVEFGRGSGALSAFFVELLDVHATPDMILEYSTRADEAGVVLTELVARAGSVIRSTR